MRPKKIEETDAIFEQLAQTHASARDDSTVLRLSLDAKAALSIGPFSRHGKTRVHVCPADHDFKPEEILTPYGIFLPEQAETYLFFTPSKVTADFIVDCLRTFWQSVRKSFPLVKTLLLNLDNGPENHSRRTQFMARLVELADEFGLTIQLAYYPPYHSKYNPHSARLGCPGTALEWRSSGFSPNRSTFSLDHDLQRLLAYHPLRPDALSHRYPFISPGHVRSGKTVRTLAGP